MNVLCSVVGYDFAINKQMVLFKHQTTSFFTCLKMYQVFFLLLLLLFFFFFFFFFNFFMNAAVEPLISMLFT
jgi:hypothetical protein